MMLRSGSLWTCFLLGKLASIPRPFFKYSNHHSLPTLLVLCLPESPPPVKLVSANETIQVYLYFHMEYI